MLDASPGAEVGLSPDQWRRLGAALARMHALPPTPELTRLVGRETFRPSRRELLPRLEAAVAGPDRDDPVAGELAALLAGPPAGDRRAGGGADRRLWIVDWDEAVLAPRERDLMFVVGGMGHGLVGPADTERFFQGYGHTSVDPDLLAYYRCAWAV